MIKVTVDEKILEWVLPRSGRFPDVDVSIGHVLVLDFLGWSRTDKRLYIFRTTSSDDEAFIVFLKEFYPEVFL